MFEAPSRSVKKAFNVAIIALCVALPTTHLAAQNAGAASDDSNAQLLEKIRQLEAKVDKLEAKLDAQASTPASAPAAATVTPAAQAAPEPAPVADQPQVNEVAERIKLLYFGDVGYERGKYYSANNTFYFGSFDMFATARLSDKVSVIGDLLLTSNADNSIGVDVERLFLKYRQNQYFSATVGRIHTDIGYYNTAFDRGEYFQTPIGRPVMYEFDDQGGFLPMQDLGVSINGEIPSGKLNLKYVFEVTNGRAYGANVEPAQNNVDLNNGKAVNFGLLAKPHALKGLLLGFSFRHDDLSDPQNLGVREIIPVVYAVYTEHNWEFLNEAMDLRHTLPNGQAFHTTGFYSQISKAFGKYRPYFVYSYVNAPLNDPILGNPAEVPVVGRVNGPSSGLRYDFTPFSAFKIQYQREYANIFNPPQNGMAAEFAFTF